MVAARLNVSLPNADQADAHRAAAALRVAREVSSTSKPLQVLVDPIRLSALRDQNRRAELDATLLASLPIGSVHRCTP